MLIYLKPQPCYDIQWMQDVLLKTKCHPLKLEASTNYSVSIYQILIFNFPIISTINILFCCLILLIIHHQISSGVSLVVTHLRTIYKGFCIICYVGMSIFVERPSDFSLFFFFLFLFSKLKKLIEEKNTAKISVN